MFDNIEITASNLPCLPPPDLRPEADVRVRVPSRVREGEPSGGVSLETSNGCSHLLPKLLGTPDPDCLGRVEPPGSERALPSPTSPCGLVWLQERAPTWWHSHCSIYLHGIWEGRLSPFWKAALISTPNKRHVRSLRGNSDRGGGRSGPRVFSSLKTCQITDEPATYPWKSFLQGIQLAV